MIDVVAGPPRTDVVDAHVARWSHVPAVDPAIEGAMTRMQHIVRHVRRMDAEAFEGSAFTLEDAHTLHALMVQPYPVEATPAQLADACHVTRAAMTSRLDRLVDGEYVTREVDPLDRRRVLVRPTAKGRSLWDKYLREGTSRDRQVLSALTPRELNQLNSLLRKVLLSLDE